MSSSASFVICCILVVGGLCVSQGSQSERLHDEWLQAKYAEATSVKAGMTRADLLKVFDMDGGLQSVPATRYVLRGTTLIKVDVEFEKPISSNDELKIKSISKPYLEPFFMD
jgi:hypothetical protein